MYMAAILLISPSSIGGLANRGDHGMSHHFMIDMEMK